MESQNNLRYNHLDISNWIPTNIIEKVCELEMQHRYKNLEEQLLFRIELWIELSRVETISQESKESRNNIHTKVSNRKFLLSKPSIFSSTVNLNLNFEEKKLDKTGSRSTNNLNKEFEEEDTETTIKSTNSRWKNFFYHHNKKRKHSYDNELVRSEREKGTEFLNEIQSIQEMHLNSTYKSGFRYQNDDALGSDTVVVSSTKDLSNGKQERFHYQQQIILF